MTIAFGVEKMKMNKAFKNMIDYIFRASCQIGNQINHRVTSYDREFRTDQV
jgi:hypothetical protein